MSFIDALNFYTKFIETLHVKINFFHDYLHENTPWNWPPDDEHLLQQLKTSLPSETEVTKPNTKHYYG